MRIALKYLMEIHLPDDAIRRNFGVGMIRLFAMALIGAMLWPASLVSYCTADDRETPRKQSEVFPDSPSAGNSKDKHEAILSGRITDETGAAVTDATIEIYFMQGGQIFSTKTDAEGHYAFPMIEKPGDHRIRIQSQRWVGLENLDETPQVTLSPETHTVKDLTLKRACRLVVVAVDESNRTVPGVTVYAKSLTDGSPVSRETVRTDDQGQAVLGLKASKFDYLIATSSPDYGFAKVEVKLDDPEVVVVRRLVQKQGISVKGKAFCSDGHPPAGWRITALPEWWNFGRYPLGVEIDQDGLFTLSHIVAENYNVSISVPRGGQTTMQMSVLKAADLTKIDGPLGVKLNYPSPASLVSLSGQIRYDGDPPKRGFWIFATSDNPQYGGSVYVQPNQTEFRIDPIPRGVYSLRVESPELESKILRNVAAPSEDVKVDLKVQRDQVLIGQVVHANTKQPVTEFRVRAMKLRNLRESYYVQKPKWQDVTDPNGRFELKVVGPGIYRVQVAANGLAWANSEEINTDNQGDKLVRLELTEGVSLTGSVVDEQGQPVDGAKVIPESKSNGTDPHDWGSFTSEEEAVITVRGEFTIAHLAPGLESLKVVHADYTPVIVKDIKLDTQSGREPLIITLKRGGTVRGRVFDENGNPEAKVILFFQKRSGNSESEAGRSGTAVTDENGDYEVSGLPEQLCYVHRANSSQATGVVAQAIFPENGETVRLDLGGSSKFTGRLLVNGRPLNNASVRLCGENPHVGLFLANSHTDEEGSFTFFGAGPGERTLYFGLRGRPNEWIRVNSFRLPSDSLDLGEIDLAVGRVTVHCEPEPPEKFRLMLQEYNARWPHGLDTGGLLPRQSNKDPFVFEHVPTGKYELVAIQPNGFRFMQRVDVTADKLNPDVTLKLPEGTASLHGKFDQNLGGPRPVSSLFMWRRDHRLLTSLLPNGQGMYELKDIPAGRYFLTNQGIRDADALLEFSIEEGESKQLDITPDVVTIPAKSYGYRTIVVYTTDGVPLPGCEILVKGPGGIISPLSTQSGRHSFMGDPGRYDLTISYPGFRTIHQTIELLGPGPDGRYPGDTKVTFKLQPEGT